MADLNDFTTLVCLFHHTDHAKAAIDDLLAKGIPASSIRLLNFEGTRTWTYELFKLEDLGVPVKDLEHLHEGLRKGGIIIAVTAVGETADTVEDIFEAHEAEEIDEVEFDDDDNDDVETSANDVRVWTRSPRASGDTL